MKSKSTCEIPMRNLQLEVLILVQIIDHLSLGGHGVDKAECFGKGGSNVNPMKCEGVQVTLDKRGLDCTTDSKCLFLSSSDLQCTLSESYPIN